MIDCRFQNKLQEAIVSIVCHRTINREDLDMMEASFLAMDIDNDGMISYPEFEYAFNKYYKCQFAEDEGLSDEDESDTQFINTQQNSPQVDLRLVFDRCDLDGDGEIDWHDFMMTACNKHRALSKYNLDEAFSTLDLFQKSFITFDDLECAFGKFDQLGTNVWEDIIIHALGTEDGLMSQQQLTQVMSQLLKE